MRPREIATDFTASFVMEEVRSGQTLLEAGCGEGELAAELMARGVRMLVCDESEAALEKARARGLETLPGAWPDVAAPPVDAVLFSRSLHHMPRVDQAIEAAVAAIPSGGAILVEDFDFRGADRATIEWIRDLFRSLEERGAIARIEGELATALLESSDPVEAWHASHGRMLHDAESIASSLESRLTIARREAVPYAFRWLIAAVPDDERGGATVLEALVRETRAAAEGSIRPIGRRWVARKT